MGVVLNRLDGDKVVSSCCVKYTQNIFASNGCLMDVDMLPLPSSTLQALYDATMKTSSIYPYPVKHLIW